MHRRAQLGVLAHIRHVYTNYEQLLRTGEWKDARAAVEHQCLDKLVQWRGDDEDDTDAMTDILREVIVIRDDEDEHDSNSRSDHLPLPTDMDREASVEVIATRAAADAVHLQQVNLRSPSNGASDPGSDSGEKYLSTYKAQPTDDRRLFDRVEAHRHRAWAAARDRQRADPQQHEKRRSPSLDGSTIARRPQMDSFRVSCAQYAGDGPEPYIDQQGFQDTMNPFASAMQRVYSPPRGKRRNPIIDLTTGSSYPSCHLYAQVSRFIEVTVFTNESLLETNNCPHNAFIRTSIADLWNTATFLRPSIVKASRGSPC